MLVFRNNSLLDLDAVRISGVSVKIGDNPIGQFGTGLKYAIAVFLRENCEVNLYVDGKHYPFRTKAITIRGKEFDVVFMGDEQLSFTTHLGYGWQPWQAFRELESNVRDEGGESDFFDIDAGIAPEQLCSPGETVLTIEGEGVEELWAQRKQIFLDAEEIGTWNNVAVSPMGGKYVYYRGVRAHTLNKASAYTYNIKSEMKLTEDRQISSNYSMDAAILQCITTSDNEDFLTVVLHRNAEYESGLPWLSYEFLTPSDAFMKVAHRLYREHALGKNVKALFFQAATRRSEYKKIRRIDVSDIRQNIIDKAVHMLEDVIGVDSILPIWVEEATESDARAIVTNEGTAVDVRLVDSGELYLASALLYAVVTKHYGSRASLQLCSRVISGTDQKLKFIGDESDAPETDDVPLDDEPF